MTAVERTVRVGDLDVFVRVRGGGPPLLMINGLGSNAGMWEAAQERLSLVAETIVFDSPGTGRSTDELWPLTIPRLARLATSLLDELGYERVDVLGFSLGGLVAQQLARDEPARVRRLALAATGCGWGGMPGTIGALATIALPLRQLSRRLYERTMWLKSRADQELVERVRAIGDARFRHPPRTTSYVAHLWAGMLWSSLSWLPSVHAPTLVLHGAEDRLVPPANALLLASLLPESRVQVLPGEGHLLLFDPDSAALPLLADFFSAETLASSDAWTHGQAVDDEAEVDAALAASVGATPHRELSALYRRVVASTRTS